jgi:hypothetical protein
VEHDRTPSPTTAYTVDHDQRLTLAAMAAERGGIQPVVTLMANGESKAMVSAGDAVTFTARAETPPGAGTIVNVEWDFEGRAQWGDGEQTVDGTSTSIEASTTHTFTTPGTYFPAVRVTSNRDGDVNAKHKRVMNLGRVRVVVN